MSSQLCYHLVAMLWSSLVSPQLFPAPQLTAPCKCPFQCTELRGKEYPNEKELNHKPMNCSLNRKPGVHGSVMLSVVLSFCSSIPSVSTMLLLSHKTCTSCTSKNHILKQERKLKRNNFFLMPFIPLNQRETKKAFLKAAIDFPLHFIVQI